MGLAHLCVTFGIPSVRELRERMTWYDIALFSQYLKEQNRRA